MRKWCPVVIIQALLLLLPTMLTAAESFVTERDIIDIVYEWSPEGNVIQVGDYNISHFESVWIDVGKGGLVQGTTGDIALGGLVKAILIDKDKNRHWLADRIVVFRGEGLEQALAVVDEDKKEQVLQRQKQDRASAASPENKQELKLEDGVWKN